MKVQNRLIFAFLLLSVAIVTILGFWWYTQNESRRALDTITADRVDPLHQVNTVIINLAVMEKAATNILDGRESSRGGLLQIRNLRTEIVETWSRYLGTYLTPEEKLIATESGRRLDITLEAFDAVVAAIEQQRLQSVADILQREVSPNVALMQGWMKKLADIQKQVAATEAARAQAALRLSTRAIILGSIAGFAVIIFTAYHIRRSILKPLNEVRAIVNTMPIEEEHQVSAADDEAQALLDDVRRVSASVGSAAAQHKAEIARLSELQTQFMSIFNHSPYGILVKDLSGRLILANHTESHLFGQDLEVIIGADTYQIVPEQQRSLVMATDRKIVETGRPVSVEYRGDATTPYAWLHSTKFPVRSNAGKIFAIGTIDIDISDSKNREIAIQALNHQFRRAARLGKILFWFSRFDPATGQTTFINDPETEQQVIGRADLQDEWSAYLDIDVHPEDRDALHAVLQPFLAGAVDQFQSQHRIFGGNGQFFLPIHLWAERVVEPETGAVTTYAMLQDISDIREKESELIDARNRAEAADRAKMDFLSSMSHELRTPLNPIIGFAELMKARFDANGDVELASYMEIIHRAGRTMLDNINVILEFAHLDVVTETVADTPFPLAPCILRAIDNVESRARDVKAEFRQILHDPNMILVGDEKAFQSALVPVLKNALQFGPAASTIDIETIELPDGCLAVAVRDRGPGMAPALIEQIGKPFLRGGNVLRQSYDGIGLGLTIARKYMELHQGRLEVANLPTGGFEARLVFPPHRIYRTDIRAARA